MSGFNGSGTFNISGIGLPYTSGTTISSSVANTLNTQLAAGLSNCITKDGQQTITANIPFSGYKITGLGNGTAAQDAVNVATLQANSAQLLTVTGTDTIVALANPTLTTYTTGNTFRFFATGTNTGAVTINIDGLGAKSVVKNGSTALVAGDITSGVLSTVVYNGTNFVLQDSFLQNSIVATQNNLMKNRIINGNMNIAQRGTSFAGVNTSTFFVDRFSYKTNISTTAVTISQDTSVPNSNQFQYSAKVLVTTTGTPTTSQVAYIDQKVEGYNVRDLIGQTFTLSFWVRSSATGTYCVFFENSLPNRAYVSEYTINTANTWEYKTITVTGGLITAGTWDWTNGAGLDIGWTLAAGSTYQTTKDAWQTGDFISTSNQVNFMGGANSFYLTGVQLEKNSTATAFEYRPYSLEFSLCQRYYQVLTEIGGAYFTPTVSNYGGIVRQFAVPMRVAPSVVVSAGGVTGRVLIADPTTYSTSIGVTAAYDGVGVNNSGTAGQTKIAFTATCSAEL